MSIKPKPQPKTPPAAAVPERKPAIRYHYCRNGHKCTGTSVHGHDAPGHGCTVDAYAGTYTHPDLNDPQPINQGRLAEDESALHASYPLYRPNLRRYRLPWVEFVTPTIRGRQSLLRRCKAQVRAQTYVGKLTHRIVLDEPPHGDRGTWAITKGVNASKADLCIASADDEEIPPQLVSKAVAAWQASDADFVTWWRTCWAANGGSMGTVTNDPPRENNLGTGLFSPCMFKSADFYGSPWRTYTQPGADGLLAYDWLQLGYRMEIVREVLGRMTVN